MDNLLPAGLRGRVILGKGNGMEELIKRLERVIQTGVPDKDGQHPISAEAVLEVVKAQLGTNCISREQAIDAINKLGESTYEVDYGIVDCDDAINAIAALPPTEPKRGKWIKTARWGRVYYCDQCRNYLDFDGVNAGRGSTNFCPNCGSRNEVTT